MADDNTRNPNVKQPGENPEGTFHYNPGNMAGKKPGDNLKLVVYRGDKRTELQVKLGRQPGAPSG